jgi:hypothetical protein
MSFDIGADFASDAVRKPEYGVAVSFPHESVRFWLHHLGLFVSGWLPQIPQSQIPITPRL